VWKETHHSVVIIGYGVDGKNKKYWIIRNSHGTGWGDNGDFKIERGTNDQAIESYATIFDPEFV